MKKVLVFGSFDPLHEGHKYFFRQARALGDSLTVIVARDAAIRAVKDYEPGWPEHERLAAVAQMPEVDEARLGDAAPEQYHLLDKLTFDILAIGYDQQPDDKTVRALLDTRGKQHVAVVRLHPFQPDKYKGRLLRDFPKP